MKRTVKAWVYFAPYGPKVPYFRRTSIPQTICAHKPPNDLYRRVYVIYDVPRKRKVSK